MNLSAGRPSREAKKTTLSDMADDKPKVRVNFDLDRDEHTRLKIYAAKTGKSIRQVLSDLIATIQ